MYHIDQFNANKIFLSKVSPWDCHHVLIMTMTMKPQACVVYSQVNKCAKAELLSYFVKSRRQNQIGVKALTVWMNSFKGEKHIQNHSIFHTEMSSTTWNLYPEKRKISAVMENPVNQIYNFFSFMYNWLIDWLNRVVHRIGNIQSKKLSC